tara:strand:- start:8295 stop:9263 length:969 start_codon:yes stop_codon:yes gene_type:complete
MFIRPRRLRKNAAIRSLVEEVSTPISSLIYPLFIEDEPSARNAIPSMPGQYRLGKEEILPEIESCLEAGLKSFCLFPKVKEALKDSAATYSLDAQNFYLQSIQSIKEKFPEAVIMTDVALDPYSSDGHDGIVKDGKILNDETIEILAKMALLQAQAGADIIGPSDMMDGRVGLIRKNLEEQGYNDTLIMSYTAKYASGFYGPFRDALDSAPKAGDKKTYQLSYKNKQEALLEATLDEQEGADILMVKPGLSYLDIIQDLADSTTLPVAAYNVSGEYAMVKAASEKGWVDEKAIVEEILTSIRRAGAKIVLTYHAKDFATWIR